MICNESVAVLSELSVMLPPVNHILSDRLKNNLRYFALNNGGAAAAH